MANIVARTSNQKNIYQTAFSARLDEQDEGYQVLEELNFYISLNTNQNSTDSDIAFFDIRSQSEQQVKDKKERLVDGNLIKFFQSQYISVEIMN